MNSHVLLFPFSEYWWFYLGFTVFICFLLLLDLGVFHRKAHEVSFKEALTWSIVWVSLAFLFNIFLYYFALSELSNKLNLHVIPGFDPQIAARNTGLEFLTGFIVEKALAADNIFVFVIIFQLFSIPLKYQHRILFFGIIGALIFRAIFIAAGAALMQYEWVAIVFGIFLIVTGIKIFFAPEKESAIKDNKILKFLRKYLPVSKELHQDKFLIREKGKLLVTPLFVALVFIEISDIVFAIDSVPAIFALTKEPLIVFTSNVFAILGLRAMFFLLANVVSKFHLLKYGLALVLVFVGLKMSFLNHLAGGKFPIVASLIIIISIITGSIVGSLYTKPKR